MCFPNFLGYGCQKAAEGNIHLYKVTKLAKESTIIILATIVMWIYDLYNH